MATLRIAVPTTDGQPTDATQQQANDAASQQAVAWTQPVHVETIQQDGQHILIYTTDAVPRPGPVTTNNIAPALLPPRRGGG